MAPAGDAAARLLDALPVAAGSVDAGQHWRHANAALAALLGEAGTRCGQPVLGLVDPGDVARLEEQLDAALYGRTVTPAVLHWRTGEGRTLRAELACGLLRDVHGAPDGWLLTLREAANDAHAAALAAAHAERDAAQHALQLFTDAVSHDLRAPLRSIDSFSSRLESALGDRPDATARDHLGRIRAAAMRMGSLLTGLSQYNRAARVDFHAQDVDFGALLDWACADLHARHPEREVEFDVPHGLTVHGDERLLQLLACQLADNAWRFAMPDAPVRVRLRGERRGAMFALTLHDHGRGFDMRYVNKLFRPFQRLHGPEEGGGHGLGLATVLRVVERHGGRIRAESAPGAGTTFHIELPAASGPEASPA